MVSEDELKLAGTALAVNLAFLGLVWLQRGHIFWLLDQAFFHFSGRSKAGKASPALTGPYEPQREQVHEQNLEVIGTMPKALDGCFVRNGPNPQMPPAGNYHVFDGDGMVHACRIKDGKVSYCNRYVETSRFKQERKAGHPILGRIGDARGKGGLYSVFGNEIKKRLGIFDGSDGGGTGNTSIVYHARRLMALNEGDLPYALRVACDGLIETLGRVRFEGKVRPSFTAHPKIDVDTGEMFFFGYSPAKAPFCHYAWADKDGNVQADFEIHLQKGIMMHDFAITKEFAVLMDHPLEFDPKMMVKKNTIPFVYNDARPSRFGVLPRYARSDADIKWFELPASMVFHTANAWQEGDLVKLYGCAWDKFDLDFDPARVENKGDQWQYLREFTFNMRDGTARQRNVTERVSGDFPQVPQRLIGRKTRYAYIAVNSDEEHGKIPLMNGVAKLDLGSSDAHRALAGELRYEAGVFGGEAFFVPASTNAAELDGEDDGYLVTFTHRRTDRYSELRVYSAKTMSAEPLARVPLPLRIPFGGTAALSVASVAMSGHINISTGFHCYHINEEQLKMQATSAN